MSSSRHYPSVVVVALGGELGAVLGVVRRHWAIIVRPGARLSIEAAVRPCPSRPRCSVPSRRRPTFRCSMLPRRGACMPIKAVVRHPRR
jgi:hypothetical protein